MARALTTSFRASLEDPHNDDPPIVFLTFDHADWADAKRFCWDTKNFVLDGETYVGFPFVLELLSDSEESPTGRLTIQNVDRMIGEAVRGLTSSPTVTLEIYPRSDWDDADPREPIGTPALQYRAAYLELGDIQVDASVVQASLRSWDFVLEPWPSVRATQSLLPGLYR